MRWYLILYCTVQRESQQPTKRKTNRPYYSLQHNNTASLPPTAGLILEPEHLSTANCLVGSIEIQRSDWITTGGKGKEGRDIRSRRGAAPAQHDDRFCSSFRSCCCYRVKQVGLNFSSYLFLCMILWGERKDLASIFLEYYRQKGTEEEEEGGTLRLISLDILSPPPPPHRIQLPPISSSSADYSLLDLAQPERRDLRRNSWCA